MRNRILSFAGAALLAAGFVYGVVQLFVLRFERGDVYPPYSSLRTDPMGTKALYEALDRLDTNVSRNYRSLDKIKDSRHKTYFFFGLRSYELESLPDLVSKDLETLAAGGGRLVITFMPERDPSAHESRWSRTRQEDDKPEDKEKEEKEKKEEKDTEPKALKTRIEYVSLAEKWGFKRSHKPITGSLKAGKASTAEQADRSLPRSVSWHTSLYFSDLDEQWKIIYTKNGEAVLMERPIGFGTVVLSSDSYLLSNEAMRNERSPELISWLIGPHTEVVFDETHFGIQENPGIAALGRRYRLRGLLAAMILLAGLFVWKNSVSFLPSLDEMEEERRRTVFRGKDFFEGLANLVQRHVPSGKVLGTCCEEWKRSCSPEAVSAEKLARIQGIVSERKGGRPEKKSGLVDSYKRIVRVVEKRR